MKKLLIAFGVVIGLLVVLAVAIPFFIDVDKYRPQIVEAANQNINGKLELGKLSLSLWGQIKVEIGGVQLKDAAGNKIVSVSNAYFHLPFSSVFAGSPQLTLKMIKPEIRVTKSKAGKLNVLTLAKGESFSADAAKGAAQKATGSAPASRPGAKAAVAVPALVSNARVGFEIRDANLYYRDETTGIDSQTKNLNLVVKDISLSHPMQAELWADLDTKMGKTFEVKGSAKIRASLKPTINGDDLQNVSFSGTIDLDKLELNLPGTFEKKSGVPLTIEMTAEASGFSSQLKYRAELKVASFSGNFPMLKSQPVFSADINVVTDQIENMSFTMKAPGNDLQIRGKMISFTKPAITLAVTSTGMDLDQLVNFPPPSAKSAAASSGAAGTASGEKSAGSSGGASGAAGTKADYDALLEPLRSNAMLVAATLSGTMNLKFVQAYGVKVTDIRSSFGMKDLTLSVDSFGMQVFAGQIKSNMAVALKPKTPTYRLGLDVAGLDLKEAVSSQLQMFKNTVVGKASFDMKGEGASFNSPALLKNLKASGKLKVTEAQFTSIDVGKMTLEALNGAIDKVGDKVPQLRGKHLPGLPNKDTKYEWITASFSIANGKFSSPDFMTKTYAGNGIDLKGSTNVGLIDYSLDTHWEVIDTYNLTKAKDLNVNIAGTDVPGILAEKGQPVKFPVSAGCTVTAPCYSYGETPGYLSKIVLGNVTGAAKGRAKQEAVNRIQQAIPQNAPQPVKDAVDKLKNLF